MNKYVILVLLFMFSITSSIGEELPLIKQIRAINDDTQNIKIKQEGNRVKVRVNKNENINTQYTDNISNEQVIQQNCNGNVDVVTVKNNQIRDLYPYDKIMKTSGAAFGLAATSALAYILVVDPYAVKINGQKYYMVKDKETEQYTINDILGYDDSKSEIFDDMKSLNSDNDTTKITGEELKKAGIRFVAVVDKKLQLQNKSLDYSLDNIEYIDLTTLRGTINNGKIGSFGYFDMYIKEKNKNKKIIGFVTFDSDETLNNMIAQ